MTADVLQTIHDQVREARTMIAVDPDVGLKLLRMAESTAGSLPSALVGDDATFRAVLDVRNELGCCVLAAERLEEAGVDTHVVVEILERGAATADRILDRLTIALQRC